jgi:hypothetical protein
MTGALMRKAFKIAVVLLTAAGAIGLGAGAADASPHHVASGGAAGCCKVFF